MEVSAPTATPGPYVPVKQEYSDVDLESLELPAYEMQKTEWWKKCLPEEIYHTDL